MSVFSRRVDILPAAQQRLWEEFRTSLPATFVLYGGTALALRTGSRESEDFDFFTNEPVDAHTLGATLRFLRGAELIQAAPSTATFLVDRGGPAKVSWKYNIAAVRIAELVGLADMMPPTIEYRYDGKTGALAWWMDSQMNEGERLKKKIGPPNPTAWNNDMYRQRVFMELVRDSDRNLTNVLISPEWRIIMIDFTRAFRLTDTIRPLELERADRALLAKMEGLTGDTVTTATKGYLTNSEVKAVMKRRDLISSHYRNLVQKLGEAKVLY